jgi:dipeptidyl aminopeptidase/acylaminoacyl peptidase
VWSPDGRQIAFLASEKQAKQLSDDADNGFAAEVFEEDWRPTKVWIVSPQFETDPWSETETPDPTALDLPGSAHALQWSPDGRSLAVALAPTPSVDDELMRQKLHIVELASRSVTATVETPGKLGVFRWSLNSQSLILIATTDVHDPREGRLLLANRDGGTPRELVPDYPGHFTQVEWLRDNAVLALGSIGVWSELLEVSVDGETDALVGPDQHVINQFALRPGSSRIALLAQSTAHPNEVFELSGSTSAPTRLTDSNPWLVEVDLAPQELVRYTARDGLELEGILIRPLNEEAGRRYPLILAVHGGPESHQANGWVTTYSRLGQAAAARGFAVFYPNYRGSTGRGVEFSKLGQSDYAGGEFNDLVDAVEHLVEEGLADPARVGVTGGSYGGFATAWCSTKLTEHFAAGVMFVGISDHISKFGTTDIPNEMYMVHARKYPWENWEWFLERSPIRYAGQSRTPLLILHGKADTRVHPSQSRELHRYLKTHGQVPVRLVEYPGEGHGNRNAGARLDYSIRALRWFQHYLQGPRGEPPSHEIDLDPYRPTPREEE